MWWDGIGRSSVLTQSGEVMGEGMRVVLRLHRRKRQTTQIFSNWPGGGSRLAAASTVLVEAESALSDCEVDRAKACLKKATPLIPVGNIRLIKKKIMLETQANLETQDKNSADDSQKGECVDDNPYIPTRDLLT